MVKGIGAVRLQLLLDHFGDAQKAWQAHPEELSATGLPPKIIKNFINLRESVSLDQVWDRIRAQTELPIQEVTATLPLMELKGMVRQVGGMRYSVIRALEAEYNTKEETTDAQ